MARISTYVIDGNIVDGDKVIGSDANNDMVTKNYTIGDLVAYFAVAIGDYLVPYANATDNVDLGPYSLSATNLSISGTFTADGTVGLPGQVLISQGGSSPAIWAYSIGSQDLQSVLTNGNTANKNILLNKLGSSITIDVESNVLSSTGIQLYDIASGNTSFWLTNRISIQDGTQSAIHSVDRIRYIGTAGNIDIVANNYNNQTFIYPNVGGAFVMSVNGVFADMSGNIAITIDGLPSQSGHAGEWLTTDGTNASWADLPSATIPNLQQVTDVGNTTTNDVTVNSLYIKTTGAGDDPHFYASNGNVYLKAGIYDYGSLITSFLTVNGYPGNNPRVYWNNQSICQQNGAEFNIETYYLPMSNDGAVIPLTVNGQLADNTGAITIPAFQDLQSVTDIDNTTTNSIFTNDRYYFYDAPNLGYMSIGALDGWNIKEWNNKAIFGGDNLGFFAGNGTNYASFVYDSLTHSTIYHLPNASGTIPLTVNGQSANTAGEITIPVGTGTVTGTGTTNYLSKWSSSTALTNSQIFDNGTNVGIGTPTPGYKLEVNGKGYFGDNVGIQTTPDNTYRLKLGNGGTMLLTSGGSPYIDFNTIATGNNTWRIENQYDTGAFNLYEVGASTTAIKALKTSGNVIIGGNSGSTTNYKLDVNGTISTNSGINIDTNTATKTGMYSGVNSFTFWAGNNQLATYTLIGNIAASYFTYNVGFNNSGGVSGTQNLFRFKGDVIDTGANSMIHNQLLIDPDYIHGVYGTGTLRGIYYNPTIVSLNGADHIAWENTTGDIIHGNLATGGADQMVTVDTSGKLKKQTIPSGGNSRSVNSVSTNTTAASAANTDYVYLVSGTTTITLPSPTGNTNLYTIKRTGTGVVSIATTSGTIDGSTAPININVQYVSIDLISDGTNWFII